jgi:hypothetical protein
MYILNNIFYYQLIRVKFKYISQSYLLQLKNIFHKIYIDDIMLDSSASY